MLGLHTNTPCIKVVLIAKSLFACMWCFTEGVKFSGEPQLKEFWGQVSVENKIENQRHLTSFCKLLPLTGYNALDICEL